MKEICAKDFDKVFEKIESEWMLISSYDKKHVPLSYNTMTASWGVMGVLWNKNVFCCFVRPQRYTKEFIDKSDIITLSFFDEKYKDALALCGRKSGRDGDKISQAGLSVSVKDEAVFFDQAKYTIVGKKIYVSEIKKECFVDESLIQKNYPDNDFHTVYVCEIQNIFENN